MMSIHWISFFVLCSCWLTYVADAKGTSFAVAFPPTMAGSAEGFCKVYINSENLGTVWVTYDGFTSEIALWPELTRSLPFDPAAYRTTSGVENKAIYLNSDVEMTVTISNSRTDSLMDNALALPLNDGPENRYFILSYPTSVQESLCPEGTPMSTYTVVATEDDTIVSVFRYTDTGGTLIDTITLNSGQTYTNSTLKTSDNNAQAFDLTGYYLETDRPVSVTAGNACTDPIPGTAPSPIISSMPQLQNAGLGYRTHPMTYPGGAGDPYLVRVLALIDGTSVTFTPSNINVQLNTGAYFDLQVGDNREVEIIECTNPCMVAQLSQYHESSAIFMVLLPPVENYVSDTVFNFADTQGSSLSKFLSIIYDTESPQESPLFLNGDDLSGMVWVNHPLGFGYLEIDMSDIPQEAYNRLTSADPEKKFSALVHAQGALGQGYGFIADASVVTDGAPPDRNDTEPPPVQSQNNTYLLNMEGDFVSSTGEAFTPVCTLQYSLAMQGEAESMLPRVNAEIGVSLCSDLSTDDVTVTSVSAPFTTNGNLGNTAIQFVLHTVLGEFGPPELESCAIQIDGYLMGHVNWDNPILDTIPGCPGVQFNSNRFNDTGNDWVCPQGMLPSHREYPVSESAQASTWVYNIVHIGDFNTADGSTIPSGCLTEHNANFISGTDTAVDTVNSMLTGGQLCELTTVQLIVDSAILSSTGNSGLSYQQYHIDYPSDVNSADLGTCAGLISQYLADHANWNQPILPPVSGCVSLEFEPEEFVENQRGWFCVDS